MAQDPSADMQKFREVVKSSRNIVAIAGAGLSAASGDRRSKQLIIPLALLTTCHPQASLLSAMAEGCGGNMRPRTSPLPKRLLRTQVVYGSFITCEGKSTPQSAVQRHIHLNILYRARKAEPNAAHMVLAALSVKETLRQICPNAESFTLVTQNIDGLSRRALDQLTNTLASNKTFEQITPDPESIIEMHGRLLATLCKKCNQREANNDSPICPALKGTEIVVEKQEQEPDIPISDLPRCTQPNCGGLLRPDVVWFGETPYQLEDIDEVIQKADLAIVVGTSSTVYPAAGYAWEVADNGGQVAVFNLDRSAGDSEADHLFLGPCAETLPQILASDQPWFDEIFKNSPTTR